jgi:hypothetical protein
MTPNAATSSTIASSACGSKGLPDSKHRQIRTIDDWTIHHFKRRERKKVVKRIKIIQPFDGIFVSLRLNNF